MTESRKKREFNLRELDILTTATALFTEQGLDNVTVADIANVADIGKGTIYKHFVSKDVILARLGNDFSERVLLTLAKKSKGKTSEEQMRNMLEICFEAYVEQPLMAEICQVYQHPSFMTRLPDSYQQKCLDLEKKYFEIFNGIIELGISNKELPNLPFDELILGSYATYTGALVMLQNQSRRCFSDAPQFSQTRFIEIIINHTMAGLFGRRFDTSSSEIGEVNE